MRTIENWLLLPVLVLYIWSLNLIDDSLDIHLHDTYYVLEGVSFTRVLAGFLLLIFGLYKIIRYRHQFINRVFALPHILLSVLLTAFLLYPVTAKPRDLDYNNWLVYQKYGQRSAVAGLLFVLIQVIFLVYFVVQLLKKPVVSKS
jgi:hypothetical protein